MKWQHQKISSENVSFITYGFSMNSSLFANSQQKIIILLGAPGAGKGTQASYLKEKYQLLHISTGDLFRENLAKNTKIGQEAKSYMDKGALVPDSIVIAMLEDRLQKDDAKKGYILDGFPRTIPQAEVLNTLIKNNPHVIALSLEVPDEMIIERLSKRLTCQTCRTPYHPESAPPKKLGICDKCQGKLITREDDKEEVIRKRLSAFHAQTEPLKEYYKKEKRLYLVDGTLSKEKTTDQIESALKNLK